MHPVDPADQDKSSVLREDSFGILAHQLKSSVIHRMHRKHTEV